MSSAAHRARPTAGRAGLRLALDGWFAHASGEASRGHGGFGIGLALVREIATRHGRDVAVVNTGPTGTTMRMRLPHWVMVSMWCR
jgi:K+-sensing histidine kinase KdpD